MTEMCCADSAGSQSDERSCSSGAHILHAGSQCQHDGASHAYDGANELADRDGFPQHQGVQSNGQRREAGIQVRVDQAGVLDACVQIRINQTGVLDDCTGMGCGLSAWQIALRRPHAQARVRDSTPDPEGASCR